MTRLLEEIREVVASAVARRLKARRVAELIRAARSYHWVGLYDVTATEIVAIAWTGSVAPAFTAFPLTQGLNGAAVAARSRIIVPDVALDPRYLTTFGATRAEAIFPVQVVDAGPVVGTIDVESDRPNAFTAEDEAVLSGCARAVVGLWS